MEERILFHFTCEADTIILNVRAGLGLKNKIFEIYDIENYDYFVYMKNIYRKNIYMIKLVFIKTYFGKSVTPKNCKNCPFILLFSTEQYL